MNQKTSEQKRTYSRTLSPKFGLLGILGLLGFIGFLPKVFHLTTAAETPFPFIFFAFFGFFGFYYEGKMSNTFIDERFQFNRNRAAAIANKIALAIIILAAIFSVSLLRLNAYDTLSLLLAVIGLCFGLSLFLQQYLLYRFENEE